MMPSRPEPIRAAIYARVSTDEQAQKFGLASQLTELRALAARKGYVVPEGAEYVDDGYSGADLERPALARLREAALLRAVDVVLVHDPDRLTRRLALQMLLLEEFERAGVRVEFLTTPRDETPEGGLLLNVKGVVAEYERLKIRERTMRGRREKARRGLVGAYPFGYRPVIGDGGKPTGQMAIHEDEASVVRMIFTWLVEEQRSARSIALELRRLGIRSPNGGAWPKSTVLRVLTNRTYTGRALFNQREVVINPRTGRKTRQQQRPEADWITIAVPAIVEPAVFERAQQQLARNRSVMVGRPNRVPYLLRGLLRCALCQHAWTAEMSHGRRMYRCGGRGALTGRCRGGSISAERVERIVWTAIVRVLRDPATLMEKLASAADALSASAADVRSQADHLRRQLAEVTKQEQRILDLFLDDSLRSEAVRGRLEQLGKRRTALAEQLARAEALAASRNAAEAQQDAIVRQCAQVASGYRSAHSRGPSGASTEPR